MKAVEDPYKITLKTDYDLDTGVIQQRIADDFGAMDKRVSWVVRTREKAIEQALIALGWTPPSKPITRDIDQKSLERALRKHGFLAGPLTSEDQACVCGLLAELDRQESYSIYCAREEFLGMIADGTIKLETDGDETGDCSRFIITTGWRQLRDLIDVLELPESKTRFAAESDITLERIETAQGMEFPKPDKLPLPTKCEGCDEAATLCETCSLDRANPVLVSGV